MDSNAHRVVITDIQIPFNSIVVLLAKWMLAGALIAAGFYLVLYALAFAFGGGVFR